MSLPQEIVHQILSNLPTKFLCTLLSTSKAIFLDVTGILHSRLEVKLLERGDHKLIFEAFVPTDHRTAPYNLSTYTHTAPEASTFTSCLYSYFALSSSQSNVWPGRIPFPSTNKAIYAFTLAPDDPWVQLSLQGNLVKLSPHSKGIIKATVPCFERRSFVRLKKAKLNELSESVDGEMIWINPDTKDIGVWTCMADRSPVAPEYEFARGLVLRHGNPLYRKLQEGSTRYTLCFEYMAMKTGFLLAKLDEMERVDRNTMAIIWRGPSQMEL